MVISNKKPNLWLLFIFISAISVHSFSQNTTPVADKPNAPETLPGKGLAEFDFFYAGEYKVKHMSIVRKGKIVWSFIDSAGKDEISDAVLMTNGNVLYAHTIAVTLINKDKKVLWNYDALPGCEIHTAQPIGNNHILFIQNGDPAKVIVINIKSGQTVKEFILPVKNPKLAHAQFRHARLTSKGTILVAHMDMGKIAEYDFNGKELLSFDAPGVWGVEPTGNGNILASCNGRGYVREFNSKGDSIWDYSMKDLADYKISYPQVAIRRANGNTIINNWLRGGPGTTDPAMLPVQAIEITPDKKIVWALRSWAEPFNLGPSTIIQVLNEPGISEQVSFGDIH